MLIHDSHVRTINAAPGELTIDPTRDYQPTGNTHCPH
jgi:hypothetical protein